MKDEKLQGNEKIETAIEGLKKEPTQEMLAHALTVIRRRMKEDAELIVLVSEEEDGEEFLASIDDDDEYEKIGNLLLEKLMGYYEGEDETEEE